MNIITQMNLLVDLDLAKKTFLVFSIASLFMIPVDGIGVYLGGTKHNSASLVVQEKSPKKIEPQEVYLKNFDRSSLFGNASSGTGTPALQVSLTELAKDYRLQGVVLTDEPEAIIQDARTQKTIFVRLGEQLGELKVKEIKEGMVILAYLGEEIKLEIR